MVRRAPLSPLRRVLVIALCAVGVIGFGCDKTPDEGQSGSADPGNVAKADSVELWTMQLKPTFQSYMSELIAAWEKIHPGIKVVWVDLPANEIENKTLTAAASGKTPDLVNLNPLFANKLASAGALKALDLPPALKGAYFDAALQANTVKGELVGIPWYLSTSVTLYNKALWKEAGLAAGPWPGTYKELAVAARTIKKKTKGHGFMPSFGDRGKFMEALAADGVPLLDASGHKAAFNTPVGVAATQFWVDLFKEGAIPKESLTQGHREAIDRFQAGQTAAFPAGPQFLTIIKQNSPKLYGDIEVGPQIAGGGGKIGVAVMNLVIPKSSQRQAIALDLATFITSGPNQLAFAKLVPILPSIKTAAADPFFKATGVHPTLEERARFLTAEQLQRATLLVPPLPHQSELAKSLDDALGRAALGQQTTQQAIEQAAQEWDRLLATP